MDQKKTIIYKLSICADTPKTVRVGKRFKITYHIKNVGSIAFPGGTIPVKISWATLGPSIFVIFPIEINKAIAPGEEFSSTHEETPLASGYTLFTIAKNDLSVAGQCGTVSVYLPDGRKLLPGMLFHAIRAKSFEETYTFWALVVSAISLFIIALEKMTTFIYVVASSLRGYHVSIIMFIVYIGIVSLPIIKISISKTFFSKIVPAGISFGMLAYIAVQGFNSIESYFMDTRGMIHVIFVGPLQEEMVKFVFFLLALLFIPSLGLNKKVSYSKTELRAFVLLGGLIGLTLAMFENLIDYGNLNAGNTFLRTIISWPLHILSISLSAFGFYELRASRKISIFIVLLSLAIFIHSIYNFLLSLLNF